MFSAVAGQNVIRLQVRLVYLSLRFVCAARRGTTPLEFWVLANVGIHSVAFGSGGKAAQIYATNLFDAAKSRLGAKGR
jgi:hypothetical protein